MLPLDFTFSQVYSCATHMGVQPLTDPTACMQGILNKIANSYDAELVLGYNGLFCKQISHFSGYSSHLVMPIKQTHTILIAQNIYIM